MYLWKADFDITGTSCHASRSRHALCSPTGYLPKPGTLHGPGSRERGPSHALSNTITKLELVTYSQLIILVGSNRPWSVFDGPTNIMLSRQTTLERNTSESLLPHFPWRNHLLFRHVSNSIMVTVLLAFPLKQHDNVPSTQILDSGVHPLFWSDICGGCLQMTMISPRCDS